MFNKLSNRFFKITTPTLSHNSSCKIFSIKHVHDNILPCSTNNPVLAKGDSAATGHFFMLGDASVLKNIKKESGISVTLPDDDVIESSHTAQLPTNFSLPSAAAKTSILPRLSSASLVSLPQLCDNDCECLLTKDSLHVVKGGNFILDPHQQGTQVLYGIRNKKDRLWDIPIPQNTPPFSKNPSAKSTKSSFSSNKYHINHISHATLDSTIKKFIQQDETSSISTISPTLPSPTTHQLHVIIRKRQLKKDLANFLSKSLFSPRLSTLKKAIKNNFLSSFPGLTETLVDKHLLPSVATEFGHLKQEKQHLQSTSTMVSDDNDFFPPRDEKTRDIIYAITEYNQKDVAAADLTGRFPYRSS